MPFEDIILGMFWLFLYMAPLAIIAGSKKSCDNEKTAWLFFTIIFSWAALVAYYATVPNKAERRERHKEQMKRQQRAEAALKKQQLLAQQAQLAQQAELAAQIEEEEQQSKAQRPQSDSNVEDSV